MENYDTFNNTKWSESNVIRPVFRTEPFPAIPQLTPKRYWLSDEGHKLCPVNRQKLSGPPTPSSNIPNKFMILNMCRWFSSWDPAIQARTHRPRTACDRPVVDQTQSTNILPVKKSILFFF